MAQPLGNLLYVSASLIIKKGHDLYMLEEEKRKGLSSESMAAYQTNQLCSGPTPPGVSGGAMAPLFCEASSFKAAVKGEKALVPCFC